MNRLETLVAQPTLRPLLPMIYVAWADGELSSAEIKHICETVAEALDADCNDVAGQWLDPTNPPTIGELLGLLREIRGWSEELPSDTRRSLSSLGLAIADLDTEKTPDSVKRALEELESSMGFVGFEATRDLFTSIPAPKPAEEAASEFDISAMTQILDGRFSEQKTKVRKFLSGNPSFQYAYDIDKEQRRALVTDWVQKCADEGLGAVAFPGVTSDTTLGDFVATFETLAYFDHSLVIKYGVQFGLFGGSIFFLGTEKHHKKYLADVASLKLPGCFAMSELGHGSNVRDCETVATYDVETKEFVINTPREMARKEWIGNAARDGQMATVFSQLRVNDVDYGVHAFVVPIRNADGSAIDNVRIEDCGHKMGLNGVDNGRLWFDNVRIPRENLLDRYASVSEEGDYTSPITSSGKRFFTMLGTLVGGRVAVGSAGLAAAKSAVTIAVRYGSARRQFGPVTGHETPILNYRTHQRRLMPLLAKSYGLTFAFQHLVDSFLAEETDVDVEALAAGLKSYATWFSTEAIQECRECCGGQGYLSVNRFAALREDTDIFATFEGDNYVLMQLVAKSRLTDFRKKFASDNIFGLVRFFTNHATKSVTEKNPFTSRSTDSAHLRSAEFLKAAMAYRDDDLQISLGRRFKKRLDAKMDPFDALNECQDHFIALANAHVERVVIEQFSRVVSETSDPALKMNLEKLLALCGLSMLQDNLGWFMEAGVIEPAKSRAIRVEVNALVAEVRDQAVHLVDGFGIPDELIGAPIAKGSMSG